MGTYGGGDVYVEEVNAGRQRRVRATLDTLTEPARQVPVTHGVDVLVLGGGPAGTTAATAVARLGARVMLVERYNQLGGLSTGGLVIWIDRMTDWDGNLVIQGLGQGLMDRLPAEAKLGPGEAAWGSREAAEVACWKPRFSAFHDTVAWAPMIDPEQLKAVSLQAVREAGAEILFHAWASTAIVEDGRLRGVVFESRQGRFAITARMVVDTTGDGDIFASAGEVSAPMSRPPTSTSASTRPGFGAAWTTSERCRRVHGAALGGLPRHGAIHGHRGLEGCGVPAA